MHIDPFLITTGIFGIVAGVGWARAIGQARNVEDLHAVTEQQAADIRVLEGEKLTLKDRIGKLERDEQTRQDQRRAAAKLAGEKSHRDAEARKAAAAAKTDSALKGCAIPPREEVVAGVRERRPRRKQSGGVLASSTGGA